MSVEIVFFGLVVIFGLTGMSNGYKRELGVTVALMLTLCLLELTEANFSTQFNSVLNFAVPSAPLYREVVRGFFYCLVLMLVVFLAYQGDFLRFPGSEHSTVLSLGSGLLNGYLLAGSIWYYLAQAGWPYLPWVGSFSQLYRAAWQVLPPNILTWPLLFVFAIGMLLTRLVK